MTKALLAIGFVGLTMLGCVSGREVESRAEAHEQRRSVPRENVARMGSALRQFQHMLVAYRPSDPKTTIHVAPLLNYSGSKEGIPDDISIFAKMAIEQIGRAVRTVDRDWSYYAQTIAALETAASMEARRADGSSRRPIDLAAPDCHITGGLISGAKRAVLGRELRAEGVIPVGAQEIDLDIGAEDSVELTTIRVNLTLRDHDWSSIDRAGGVYEVSILKCQNAVNFSIHFAGSGVGVQTKFEAAHDVSTAIADATAACAIHLLGCWKQLPYYRVSPIFARDEYLERDVRRSLRSLSTAQLDAQIFQWYLAFDPTINLAESDKGESFETAVFNSIRAAMQSRRLSADRTEDKVEFALTMWREIDFEAAEGRILDADAILRQRRADEITATTTPAATAPKPAWAELFYLAHESPGFTANLIPDRWPRTYTVNEAATLALSSSRPGYATLIDIDERERVGIVLPTAPTGPVRIERPSAEASSAAFFQRSVRVAPDRGGPHYLKLIVTLAPLDLPTALFDPAVESDEQVRALLKLLKQLPPESWAISEVLYVDVTPGSVSSTLTWIGD